MSSGSTQSFFSICRMRFSAEIGSEKITRSTRVRRPNSTRSSTLPSFGSPAQSPAPRSSVRSSNKPMISHAGVALLLAKFGDDVFARRAAADDDGAAGRRPSRVHLRTAKNSRRRDTIKVVRPPT